MESILRKPNQCENELITQKSDKFCNYKPIADKRYFIRTSDQSIYVFTREPLKIEINCIGSSENNTKTIESGEIQFSRICAPRKFDSKHIFDGTTISNLNVPEYLTYPKLEYFNVLSKEWTKDISIIEKNQIALIKMDNKMVKIIKESERNKVKIEEVKFNIEGPLDFLINKVTKATWNYLLKLLIIPLLAIPCVITFYCLARKLIEHVF